MKEEKSSQLNLSQKEIDNLKRLYQKAQDRHISERILCVLLKNQGRTDEEVGEILLVDAETVSNWLNVYLEEGINDLLKSALREEKSKYREKKWSKSRRRRKNGLAGRIKLYILIILISAIVGLTFCYLTGGLSKLFDSIFQRNIHRQIEQVKEEEAKYEVQKEVEKETQKKLRELQNNR